MVKVLLEAKGIDIKQESIYGTTPLSIAKEKGHTEIVNAIEAHILKNKNREDSIPQEEKTETRRLLR